MLDEKNQVEKIVGQSIYNTGVRIWKTYRTRVPTEPKYQQDWNTVTNSQGTGNPQDQSTIRAKVPTGPDFPQDRSMSAGPDNLQDRITYTVQDWTAYYTVHRTTYRTGVSASRMVTEGPPNTVWTGVYVCTLYVHTHNRIT